VRTSDSVWILISAPSFMAWCLGTRTFYSLPLLEVMFFTKRFNWMNQSEFVAVTHSFIPDAESGRAKNRWRPSNACQLCFFLLSLF
jgi:hypothetical protein